MPNLYNMAMVKARNKTDKPILGITMGDPAGIGPEVIVKALARPLVRRLCRPVVIGSPEVLAKVAGQLKAQVKIRPATVLDVATPPGAPVAVPSAGDFLAIVGNTASASLMAAVEGATRERVPDLKTVALTVLGNGELLPDTRRSDHAAFWHYGYPAVMLTDTADFRNPHYHRSTDRLDTLNLEFMENVAQAVTAAAIRLCTTLLSGSRPS